MNIAVIGAGLSGLACARTLLAGGHAVTVFEKAAGPGGRLSTSRRDDWQADLGAQYFTVRDPRFRAEVADWAQAGVVAPWPGRGSGREQGQGSGRLVWLEGGQSRPVDDDQVRYVGTPRMSAITRQLSQGLEIHNRTRVCDIQRQAAGLRLRGEDALDLGQWSHVVVSAPAPQAEALLSLSPELARAAAGTVMHGCWTLIVRSLALAALDYDGAFIVDQPLRWMARDSSKPGRGPGQVWVLHADAAWSEQEMESPPEQVGAALLDCLRDVTGLPLAGVEVLRTHRWRFASCATPLRRQYLLDAMAGLSACGDWCNGDRVEGAWLSGRLLGEQLLETLQGDAVSFTGLHE